MAQPLGIGTTFSEGVVGFGRGDELFLHTDGLVESRTRDVTLGLERLHDAVRSLRRPVPTAGARCSSPGSPTASTTTTSP